MSRLRPDTQILMASLRQHRIPRTEGTVRRTLAAKMRSYFDAIGSRTVAGLIIVGAFQRFTQNPAPPGWESRVLDS